MTRSGRITTQPAAEDEDQPQQRGDARASCPAGRPTPVGDSDDARCPCRDWPATQRRDRSSEAATASTQPMRRKRTVRMYSTPSGQARAIEHQRAEQHGEAELLSSRNRPSGPLPESDSVVPCRRRSAWPAAVPRSWPVRGLGASAPATVVLVVASGGDRVVGDGEREAVAAAPAAVGVGDPPADRARALRQRVRATTPSP